MLKSTRVLVKELEVEDPFAEFLIPICVRFDSDVP